MEQVYGEEVLCDSEQVKRVLKGRLCDYCGELGAEGYVPQYRVWVYEACYEDHHGLIY